MRTSSIATLSFGGLGVALAVACSGSVENSGKGEDAGSALGTTLPCDVDDVLARNCRKCHSSPPQFGAPMPLTTYADLRSMARSASDKHVFEQVGVRIHDDNAPMPQPPNPRLDARDMATLDDWIARGGPAGTTTCEDAGLVGARPQALGCNPDQRLRPASKFAMTGTKDVYVCYGFDTSSAEKRHVIAGAPHIDNARIVHHVLIYQAESAVDGAPHACGAGGGRGWRLVTGWAPGGKNFELPAEAGFAEEAGTTHWAVQVHYNNTQGLSDQVDETGYDFCSTTTLRPNDADIMATGTFEIELPPRSTTETTCEVSVPEAFGSVHIVSSWAHMHRLGRAQYAKRIRSGVETTLLDAPTYDFNTGAGSQDVNVDVAPGDTIRTMCRWKNGSDATVTQGEKTDDEMCFAFLTYYPKITIPKFQWSVPSLPAVSKCNSVTTP